MPLASFVSPSNCNCVNKKLKFTSQQLLAPQVSVVLLFTPGLVTKQISCYKSSVNQTAYTDVSLINYKLKIVTTGNYVRCYWPDTGR